MADDRRYRFRLALLAIGVGMCDPARSVNLDVAGITAEEMQTLPEYCRARYGNDQVLKARWDQQMGTKHFLHVHHYCSGLNFMRRAGMATDSQKRRIRLQTASNEFDYVLRNWPPDFYLYAPAKQQKALANAMLRHL